jgi:hypothetical protein
MTIEEYVSYVHIDDKNIPIYSTNMHIFFLDIRPERSIGHNLKCGAAMSPILAFRHLSATTKGTWQLQA